MKGGHIFSLSAALASLAGTVAGSAQHDVCSIVTVTAVVTVAEGEDQKTTINNGGAGSVPTLATSVAPGSSDAATAVIIQSSTALGGSSGGSHESAGSSGSSPSQTGPAGSETTAAVSSGSSAAVSATGSDASAIVSSSASQVSSSSAVSEGSSSSVVESATTASETTAAQGSTSAQTSATSAHEISTSAQESSTSAQEISTSAQESSTSVHEISTSAQETATSAQETSTSAQETATSSAVSSDVTSTVVEVSTISQVEVPSTEPATTTTDAIPATTATDSPVIPSLSPGLGSVVIDDEEGGDGDVYIIGETPEGTTIPARFVRRQAVAATFMDCIKQCSKNKATCTIATFITRTSVCTLGIFGCTVPAAGSQFAVLAGTKSKVSVPSCMLDPTFTSGLVKTTTTSALVSSTASTSTQISSIVATTSASSTLSASSTVSSVSSAVTSSVASSSVSSTVSSTVSSAASVPTGAADVAAKILIIAQSKTAAYSVYSGLLGYGIPYEILEVPSTGVALPKLSNSASQGNYGGIVVQAEVTYPYAGATPDAPVYSSALTAEQWQELYDYQNAFGVRMVRLDVYPGPNFGATVAGDGCCGADVEQLVSLTNTTSFATANLKSGATMSTKGLFHYPATITDPTTTWEVAKFGAGGSYTADTVAAVINQYSTVNGTRQQMAWFTGFASDWSVTSNFLMHSWIHWVTRGTYVGFRRIYLGTQIDDVHLMTDIYYPAGILFRLRADDLAEHARWTPEINQKMPAGSNYWIELGHNGNGNIENATSLDPTGTKCKPVEAIEYDEQIDTPLEFVKPLGSGTDIWPKGVTEFTWDLNCADIDPLLKYISNPVNRDVFGHISHTFTHEGLNNATFADTNKEITFNQKWLDLVGISKAKHFSPNGIIPPAITGLHNGDAIRAFMTNGIKYVVGDNTRPPLMNKDNEFWTLTSTVADNGYDGLEIIPRWATTIYYNCDTPACTLEEWKVTSAGQGDFENLLNDARSTNTRHLLGLHHDPYMFHQANLRYIDVAPVTVNGDSKPRSLLQTWVELIVDEMVRLTDWPMITLGQDDIAKDFIDRRTRDRCNPQLSYTYSTDRKSIIAVTVTADGNTCAAAIPVTVPVDVVSAQGFATEKIGSDPLTIWAKLAGSPVTFQFATPVSV